MQISSFSTGVEIYKTGRILVRCSMSILFYFSIIQCSLTKFLHPHVQQLLCLPAFLCVTERFFTSSSDTSNSMVLHFFLRLQSLCTKCKPLIEEKQLLRQNPYLTTTTSTRCYLPATRPPTKLYQKICQHQRTIQHTFLWDLSKSGLICTALKYICVSIPYWTQPQSPQT